MSASDVSRALAQALELCRRGAFADAERIYREIVGIDPDAPDAWNMLAVVLQRRNALSEAWDASSRAVALRPAIAPYWLVRGNIAADASRYDDAEASYRRACEIDGTFAEARYRLGLVRHRLQRFDEALQAYAEAARYAPEVGEIYWHAAEALVALERADAAIPAYEQAFRLDPARALDRHSAFDCLGRLHFDALPQLWHDEVYAAFSDGSFEKRAYVPLALKLLGTKPAFRSALASPAPVELDAKLADPLFVAVLRDGLVTDAAYERMLAQARGRLALDARARAAARPELLGALAHQCFSNEFVYDESPPEREAVLALKAALESRLEDGPLGADALREMLVVAMYLPLDQVAGIERVLTDPSITGDTRLLLERAVVNPRTERDLRQTIAEIVPIEAGTSQAVRGMYEENPYPRWFTVDREAPMPIREWLARELPGVTASGVPDTADILVAGCGTGHDAIWLASNIAQADVLGVDLSLSSLSYGKRMAVRLGVENVEFRQGDILRLGELDRRFDLIASTGVLHHMREPIAGLRAIAKLLRKGGLMKLGFYSRRARVGITAARDIIAAEGIPSTASAIRAFRQRIFASQPDSKLNELRFAPDLYSTSMCRDLLFHVQEHQYTLPELAEMLDACGLTFLGLSDLPPEALGRYRRMYPDDASMNDISRWDSLEQRYPETFSRMFLFWCQAST